VLDQSISNYLQAVRRREEARKRFNDIAEIVNQAAQQIAETQKNTTPGNPRVYQMGHPFGLNGGIVEPHRWPTADAINNACQELRAAVTQVEDAWNSIPHDQRLGLSPPHAIGGSSNG
jgi:hypothetical protein